VLDIKRIREQPDVVNAELQRRKPDLSIDAVLALDTKRLALLQEEETLRGQRNALSKQVGEAKRQGHDATELLQQSQATADRIKTIEAEKDALATEQEALLLNLPNLPSPETPTGTSEADNPEVRRWGDEFKTRPPEAVLPHWEIGTSLGMLDFERGVKVAQSRFTVLRGWGARLERALIQLMLDIHTHEHGYEEVAPPFMVNTAAMTGTGQLPKFADDMFRMAEDALFLIPTAEVPVTNLYRDEILDPAELPKAMVAYTPCFRREAGSAGRDTRGLIRQHQFNKVELVHLTTAEASEATHQALVRHAEMILQRLELPYRVVELCTADLGFSASRCYDIEVWMPAQGVYREISSCSNMADFQARRMNLKTRDTTTGKPVLCHTLNGSGLAVGRTLAALLENYQDEQGRLRIPTALKPYLGPQDANREFIHVVDATAASATAPATAV
jgi:seryl-tRNA synthetase